MVTSANNPEQQTFVHVNEIKYHTDDAIPVSNGSVFIPITSIDIKKTTKKYGENKQTESVILISFVTLDFLGYQLFVKNTMNIRSNYQDLTPLISIDRLKFVCILLFIDIFFN